MVSILTPSRPASLRNDRIVWVQWQSGWTQCWSSTAHEFPLENEVECQSAGKDINEPDHLARARVGKVRDVDLAETVWCGSDRAFQREEPFPQLLAIGVGEVARKTSLKRSTAGLCAFSGGHSSFLVSRSSQRLPGKTRGPDLAAAGLWTEGE